MTEDKKQGDVVQSQLNENKNTALTDKMPVGFLVHAVWAFTLVVIVCVFAFWLYPVMTVEKATKTGIEALQQVLQPQIDARKLMSQTLGIIDGTKKLVVHTQEVDVEIEMQEQKRIFSEYIPAGSASVKMKVMGNRVQFYVPLDKITAESFFYDHGSGVLSIKSPGVVMDKDMISVQSDPQKIIIQKENSWVPFGPRASNLLEVAKSELRNEVISAADNELVWRAVEYEAHQALNEFFSILKSSMTGDTKLQIIIP